MAKSKGKKGSGKPRRKSRRAKRPAARKPYLFPVAGLVRNALAGGREILAEDDPLLAESWASAILGAFYKPPVPLEARQELEDSIGPAIVRGAERKANREGLALLRALAAVSGDDIGAREAAERLAARGVPEPSWAAQIGNPEFLSAWAVADPYDDQIAYSMSFRYEGRPPHTLMALYDESLGGIIKDATVGEIPAGVDPRRLFERQGDAVRIDDLDGGVAAARIAQAIATGDLFVDSEWTDDFNETRALLLARLRLLPADPPSEEPPALDGEAQEALVQDFLASPFAPGLAETLAIVDHCFIARCVYGAGDPLHWSPSVVDVFMLDYLPSGAALTEAETRAVPEVLSAWVRFALTKRGLEERWIVETQEAVQECAPEFQSAMEACENLDAAKAATDAMRAAGVDLSDQKAVDAWVADFNSRPLEERERFFEAYEDL